METIGKPILCKCSECRRVKPDVLKIKGEQRWLCGECREKNTATK